MAAEVTLQSLCGICRKFTGIFIDYILFYVVVAPFLLQTDVICASSELTELENIHCSRELRKLTREKE